MQNAKFRNACALIFILLRVGQQIRYLRSHTSLRKERGGPTLRKVILKTQNKASEYLYIKFSLAGGGESRKPIVKTNCRNLPPPTNLIFTFKLSGRIDSSLTVVGRPIRLMNNRKRTTHMPFGRDILSCHIPTVRYILCMRYISQAK